MSEKHLGSQMHDHINADPGVERTVAQDWAVWSRSIGLIALPYLEELLRENAHIKQASVCSGDGLNLVSLGLSEEQVGHFAALASSVFGVAGALGAVTNDDAAAETSVEITAGGLRTALHRVDVRDVGQLIVVATAEGDDDVAGKVRELSGTLKTFLEGN